MPVYIDHPACTDEVVAELARKHGDAARAARSFDELLNFLHVAGKSGESLSPSTPVDAAWHQFLTHGDDYRAYCVEHWGHVLFHEQSSDAQRRRVAYDRARALLVEQFGELDPELWPAEESAGCGIADPQPDI